jgi:hypothetical protein
MTALHNRLGNDPKLIDAVETLIGIRQCPPNTDRAAYLRQCQAVIEGAVDQFEIQRLGQAVFWPRGRSGCTTLSRQDFPEDTQTQSPSGLDAARAADK